MQYLRLSWPAAALICFVIFYFVPLPSTCQNTFSLFVLIYFATIVIVIVVIATAAVLYCFSFSVALFLASKLSNVCIKLLLDFFVAALECHVQVLPDCANFEFEFPEGH